MGDSGGLDSGVSEAAAEGTPRTELTYQVGCVPEVGIRGVNGRGTLCGSSKRNQHDVADRVAMARLQWTLCCLLVSWEPDLQCFDALAGRAQPSHLALQRLCGS